MRTPLRRRGATAGTVAIEFGLIGMAFFGLLLVVFELGFFFFAQNSLDFAAREAARQMQTGQATATDSTSFQSLIFCPYLSPFLNCANVVIVLQPVTDFQAAMTTPPPAPFNGGAAGSLMLLQATYTNSLPLWPLNVRTVVGTAAYRNE